MNSIVKIFLLSSLLLFSNLSIGQNLTLANLEKIMRNSNWSYSDNFLSEKGWVYTGYTNNSVGKRITWGYEYDRYNKSAFGWLYLNLEGDKPSSLTYEVFNLKSSNLVNNRIISSGYISKRNKITDNSLMKAYSKGNILLATSKNYDSENGLTTYEYNLVRKGGHYDSQNGKKTEYSSEAGGWIEYTMRDGEIQGPFVIYYSKGGSIKKKSYIQNGKPNGNTIEYYEDGQVSKRYLMKNGNKTGLEIEYHPNGEIKRKCNYSNGVQNGKTTEYDENGQTEEIYFQKDGELELIKVFENGKLSVEMNISNNKKNGMYTSYDDKGRVVSKGNYTNNLKTGAWENYTYFSETGDIGKIYTEFKEGEKDGIYRSSLVVNKKEQVLSEINYVKDEISGIAIGFVGDTIVVNNFFNGKLDGSKKNYLCPDIYRKTNVNEIDLEKLTILFDGHYLFGDKTGSWKYYSRENLNSGSNRLPYLTETYKGNKLNGLFERRDELGNITEKGSYLNDLKHGEWSYVTYKGDLKDEVNRVTYQNGFVKGYTELYRGDKLVYSGLLQERESDSKIFKDGFWVRNITDLSFDNRDNIYQKCNYNRWGKLEGKSTYECGNEILNKETYYFDDLVGKCTYYDSNIRKIEKQYLTRMEKLDLKNINSNLFSINLFDSLGKNLVSSFTYTQNNDYTKTDFNIGYCTIQDYERTDKFEKVWENIAKSKDPNIGLELNKLISNNAQVKQGDFIKISSNHTNQNTENDTLIIGSYRKNSKDGVWTFFHVEQKLKIIKNYNDGESINPEKYLNLDGTLYSGKYTIKNLADKRKEVISVKNGLRNGKTMVYSLTDNEIINKIKYKNGLKK